MSLEQLIHAIYASPVSVAIRDTEWVVPVVQSLHICAIAVVVGSSLVTELRLAGVMATDATVCGVVRRYLPWMWGALGLLLATGLIMAIGEPERVLGNSVFWVKMLLVSTGGLLTLAFRKPFLDPHCAVDSGWRASWVKPSAWLLLAIWVTVVWCGRWIAYTG